MKNSLYFLGYDQVKLLLSTPGMSEQEKAAIRRLDEFNGTAADLELAASLYDEMGEPANAADLRKLLSKPSRGLPCVSRGEAAQIGLALKGTPIVEQLDEAVERLTKAIQTTQKHVVERMKKARSHEK